MRLTLAEALALLSFAAQGSLAQKEPSRPRGVGPEFAKFYKSTDSFTCISNPSITIPIKSLNDDYCDCPDGSDEPGTSACSHLSPLSPPSVPGPIIDDAAGTAVNTTLALPGFYCKNKGHQPQYVPFIAVNDGVCDYELCCDGSDEWEGVGGTKCEDKCKEIGKEFRKADEARQKAMTAAKRARQQLLADSDKLMKEVEDRIQTLKTEMQGAEIHVSDMEKEYAEIERLEKRKVVKAPKEGGKMGTLVELAKERMDELKTTLERMAKERTETNAKLKELEEILERFKEERNPNFNDEGVKRAVVAWENYAARDRTSEELPVMEGDLRELLKSDAENGVNWEEFIADSESSDVDVLYQIENYLPPSIREWVDSKLRDLRVFLQESGVIAHSTDSTTESKAVTDARERLNSAKSDLTSKQNELKNHEEDLTKDYGPDSIFRSLKGKCISTESGEYTYELCWMDRTTQKAKKGGSNTGMGNYQRFDKVVVDEELPPDGRGLGEGERFAMRYENGQHCWNGPSRSTLVVMACAEKDEIWKVVEEEKCVYKMEVGTPAVCVNGANGHGKKEATQQKDEL